MSKILAFKDYLKLIDGKLPSEISRTLPVALSGETKKKLLDIEPDKTVTAIREAIDEINQGSYEKMDTLIRKKLGIS